MRRLLYLVEITAFCLTGEGGALSAQRCDAPHYRWPMKVSTALMAQRPETTTIAAILSQWSIPAVRRGAEDWCTDRVGRERDVYALEGWLRYADTTKDDGDWHLELTQGRDDARDQCIVVEIPAARWGHTFAEARALLDTLIHAAPRSRRGHIDPPVRVRVIGPAFFDGEHLHGHRQPRPEGHGHCNSSLRALWEIHPVYHVERP